jgi:Ca2+-binding RTX toxin-like protein
MRLRLARRSLMRSDPVQAGKGNEQPNGAGDDSITGGHGADQLYGQAGNDSLIGTDGTIDTLDGGGGVDSVLSDASDDVLNVP